MNELESLYGAVGLGLITVFLPYFLQVVKMLTNIEGTLMLWVSVVATYVLVDLYYVATVFMTNPELTISSGIFIILGMIIYPLMTWFGGQGVYSKVIRGYQK